MRKPRRRRPRVLSTLAPRTIEMADIMKSSFGSRSRVIDEAVRSMFSRWGRRP